MLGDDGRGLAQQRGLDLGIGLDRRLEIRAGLVDGRANIGIERADLPGQRPRFDRGLDRPAIGVAQTIIALVLRTATLYSRLAIIAEVAILPATRATNRCPML